MRGSASGASQPSAALRSAGPGPQAARPGRRHVPVQHSDLLGPRPSPRAGCRRSPHPAADAARSRPAQAPLSARRSAPTAAHRPSARAAAGPERIVAVITPTEHRAPNADISGRTPAAPGAPGPAPPPHLGPHRAAAVAAPRPSPGGGSGRSAGAAPRGEFGSRAGGPQLKGP